MPEGVDGLLRDKTRPPGRSRLPDAAVRRVLDLTLPEPPGEATHWTGRMMARASDVSLRSVGWGLSWREPSYADLLWRDAGGDDFGRRDRSRASQGERCDTDSPLPASRLGVLAT